jgi:glycosyltransferase 2 family protein
VSGDPGAAPRAPDLAGLKRALRPLLVSVALGFVAYAAWDLSGKWDARDVRLAAWPLALSLVPIAGAALAQALAWIWLIEDLAGKAVPRRPALALYLDSQMARYTPGKVGLPLVRMAGAPQLGVSATLIASSIGIEHLSWLAVGGSLGFASFSWWNHAGPGLAALFGSGALVLTVVFVIVVLALLAIDRRHLPRALTKLTGEGGRGPLLRPRVPFAHVMHWTCWGLHGALLARGVGAEGAAAFGGFSILILAPIAGFLALVAPAGAGVREAVMSVGLAPVVGAAPALVAAVAARIASLVVDLLTWISARLLLRRASATKETAS